ncbi:hypothetical protein AB1Y20_009587 [Prymnesium parvum]|uniref:IMS import disulfide relay-system CHCH-CHCH-like Cx9C domain-containing protein n=1 Tax=Prymnesium parvum TaxID=97485 RepID=A0AB34K2K2_PRYPA
MEAAMDQVARHCTPELAAYAKCVDSHPTSWNIKCAPLKTELTACAAKHSGMVNRLKTQCKEEIEQYERCLKANTANSSTCTPQLERLWACSEGEQQSSHVCDGNCRH